MTTTQAYIVLGLLGAVILFGIYYAARDPRPKKPPEVLKHGPITRDEP